MSTAKKFNVARFWLFWDRFGVFIIFLIVAIIFMIIEPRVVQPAQLLSVLTRSSWTAVAAVGMTFAICSRGFDLSVGSIMSLCGSLIAKLIMENGFSTGAAVAITFLIAICCGTLNGVLITKVKIQPFVATLATMLIFDGVTQTYTGNIGTFIDTASYGQLYVIGRGALLGFPIKLVIVIIVFALAILIYRSTKFGTKVRAVGSNELAARTSGINADLTLLIVYISTAVTAALAALMYTATVQSASPNAGSGFELDVITAVVLGGTALTGGRGNLVGTYVGAVLVAFVKMCMTFISAPEAMQVIVTGVVLVFALSINGIKLITQREVK
jgi:ribose/xylose/arabinose/galactoside ABC-type transport system permease subunit